MMSVQDKARSKAYIGFVAVVLVAAAVGWFIPLFGLSLVAFVVVDVVIGIVRRATA